MSETEHANWLKDVERAGVYRLPPSERASIEAAAGSLGMRVLTAELAGVRDKQTFLATLAAALRLPAYFGGNWDALEESLADLREGPGFLVVLAHAGDFAEADPGEFAMALAILETAAELWRSDDVPFWTLVEADIEGLAALP